MAKLLERPHTRDGRCFFGNDSIQYGVQKVACTILHFAVLIQKKVDCRLNVGVKYDFSPVDVRKQDSVVYIREISTYRLNAK